MTTNTPALRATINQIEGHRDRAITLFRNAFDLLQMACEEAGKAMPSNPYPISVPDRARNALVEAYHINRETFVGEMTKELDRGVWKHLLDHMGLEPLMDAQAREEFRRRLRDDPPPATAENCHATMGGLIEDADLIFKRGLANAFSRLDRRFRSHDGFKIGSRIVLSYAFREWGGWGTDRDEMLRDVERVFLVLDGKQQPERFAGIVGLCDAHRRQRPFDVANDYFRVVAFKNGNAHVWFKRKDLVGRVNKVLADYYGETLGVRPDAAKRKHGPNRTPAKRMGFFETPAAVVTRMLDEITLDGLTLLEPSAGRGAIAVEAQKRGAKVTCIEIQGDNVKALHRAGLTDVRHSDFFDCDPRVLTQRFDRIAMNPPFDQGRDVDHVTHALQFLKPGGRLISVMSAGVEFREDARTTAFRDLVEQRKGRFYDLPAGSFKEAGTMVNTVLAIIPG